LAPPRPSKKDVALALLEQSSVFIHLDPRRDKVVVPQTFREQPELVLQFGLNMRIPIPDLEVTDEAIAGTLSFARRPFWCWIPWEAVFAIFDQERRGLTWPEDAPAGSKLASAISREEAAPKPKRPHLRAVTFDEAAPEPRQGQAGEGEGACALCSTRWVEDASSCPVCGASREEAFRPVAALPVAAPPPAAQPERTEQPEEPPPDGEPPPPPKRPHLRLVKK
jgi:stringent starvation protein B